MALPRLPIPREAQIQAMERSVAEKEAQLRATARDVRVLSSPTVPLTTSHSPACRCIHRPTPTPALTPNPSDQPRQLHHPTGPRSQTKC